MGCGASSARDVAPQAVAHAIDSSVHVHNKEILLETSKAIDDVSIIKEEATAPIRTHSQLLAEVSAQLEQQLSAKKAEAPADDAGLLPPVASSSPPASPRAATLPAANPEQADLSEDGTRDSAAAARAPSEFKACHEELAARAASESHVRSSPIPAALTQCNSWSAANATVAGSSPSSSALIAAGMQKFMACSADGSPPAASSAEDLPPSEAYAAEAGGAHVSMTSLPSGAQHAALPEAYLAMEPSEVGAPLSTVPEESEQRVSPNFQAVVADVVVSRPASAASPAPAATSSRPASAAAAAAMDAPKAGPSRPASAVSEAPAPKLVASSSRPASAAAAAPPAAHSPRPASAAATVNVLGSRPASAAAAPPAEPAAEQSAVAAADEPREREQEPQLLLDEASEHLVAAASNVHDEPAAPEMEEMD